jgi:hypothetical protein
MPIHGHGFLGIEGVQVCIGLPLLEQELDVIVATHKIIDLVFHTQVYKLKRDMAKKPASVSSSSLTWKDTMERSDETPADSPTTERGRSALVGAAAQGTHNHSGTSGGHPCK